MSTAGIVITVIAACVFFILYAAWPYNGRKDRMREFCGWYYAHRGLHDKEDAPENSMLAFERAVEKVLLDGWRTSDICEADRAGEAIGCREMTEKILEALGR